VDDSGDWDIDGGNPAEEQVREWLVNRRLGGVTGTTPLEAELKRLDTAVVVQWVLRELWSKYPCECEGMGLVQPGPDTLPDETAAEPSKAAGGGETPPTVPRKGVHRRTGRWQRNPYAGARRHRQSAALPGRHCGSHE